MPPFGDSAMLSELTKWKTIAVVALLILLDTCISTICETFCGQVSCDISYKAPLRNLSNLFKSNGFLRSGWEEGEDQRKKMAVWQHCCSGPDSQQHYTGKETIHVFDRIQCILSFADFKVFKIKRYQPGPPATHCVRLMIWIRMDGPGAMLIAKFMILPICCTVIPPAWQWW